VSECCRSRNGIASIGQSFEVVGSRAFCNDALGSGQPAPFSSHVCLKRPPLKGRHYNFQSLEPIPAIIMGGPGSGGYKSLPGDVETHSAWDIIPPDPKGTQVPSHLPSAARQIDLTMSRSWRKYDASTARGRWRNTPHASECTSLAATHIWMK